MTRGLLWFPLLLVFIGLAWAGWNEYRKLEAYQTWAAQFEKSKYDIYAVLGLKGHDLTWGKPTRQGPVNLQTISLAEVEAIRVLVGDRPVEEEDTPATGDRVVVELRLPQRTLSIPFTEIPMAIAWGKFLQNTCAGLRSSH